MKYATVEEVTTSFPHPILPTVQGDPDYQTIHAIGKLLQLKTRAIETHIGGGALGHLGHMGLIVLYASYVMVSPATEAGPTLWVNPPALVRAPENTAGTATQISAARHSWEQDVHTYRINTSVQQALRKQVITVFEPIYLDILYDDMVGFNDVHLIYSRKVLMLIVNHEVINIMSSIGSLVIVYKYFVTWI
jgi:hypothetical protein